MSFIVAEALERDVDAMVELASSIAGEERYIGAELPFDTEKRVRSMFAAISRPDALVLVARSDGLVIEEATLRPQWPGLLSLGMAVDRNWRSKGVGSALLARAIAWAYACDAHKITLEVFAHNAGAIGLYTKHGFEREGLLQKHLRRNNGELWDVVPMGLLLGDRFSDALTATLS